MKCILFKVSLVLFGKQKLVNMLIAGYGLVIRQVCWVRPGNQAGMLGTAW